MDRYEEPVADDLPCAITFGPNRKESRLGWLLGTILIGIWGTTLVVYLMAVTLHGIPVLSYYTSWTLILQTLFTAAAFTGRFVRAVEKWTLVSGLFLYHGAVMSVAVLSSFMHVVDPWMLWYNTDVSPPLIVLNNIFLHYLPVATAWIYMFIVRGSVCDVFGRIDATWSNAWTVAYAACMHVLPTLYVLSYLLVRDIHDVYGTHMTTLTWAVVGVVSAQMGCFLLWMFILYTLRRARLAAVNAELLPLVRADYAVVQPQNAQPPPLEHAQPQPQPQPYAEIAVSESAAREDDEARAPLLPRRPQASEQSYLPPVVTTGIM